MRFVTLKVSCFMYYHNNYDVKGSIFLFVSASYTDISDYNIGKALKGAKFYPKISPKKHGELLRRDFSGE